MVRQCQLTGISRSGLYYRPVEESAENLELMRLLDEQYTRTPFYGVRRMASWLGKQGYGVNVKRVRRLLRQMGLEAIYPKPRLSASDKLAELYDLIDGIFKAALKFYRLQRGTGEEAKDVSTFFQLSKLHQRFARFWASHKNPYRVKG